MTIHDPLIAGHGGGSKKNPSKSADDTLRSFAHVKFVDAISEGPIVGLVNGAQSILINKTPITNVEDSSWQFRAGNPDDTPLAGINSTEAFVSVGAEVSEELGAVIRTITDTDLDAVKILMQLNVLYRIDSKGALKTTDSGWRIDLRAAGASEWTEVVTFNLENEKTTSPTQFQHTVPLTGDGPWDIRVRHRYGERNKHEQSITWTGYSEVTDGRFTHPHTALVGLALSSEHVGGSIPTRHYHIKGRKILVPSNYNALTRTYSGAWNGTFIRAWSDNPAWVFYDMVENNIFGIGAEIDLSVVNKWRLYTIAQYCDQLVPSGYKDENGVKVMEPRYTFNGVITDKKEAFDALRAMTTVWRGMGFYTLNQFFTTVDMPQDPAHIYGPANVIDGRFEYSTSSVKTRHSVVMVKFNDPNNLFQPAVEPVVDDEMLQKFGWREKTLQLTGCSSRSLAHRYGRWVLETEKSETETVSFSVGLDSIHALPGEVIAINDPRRAEVRMSGRIASTSGNNTVVFDQTLDPVVNRTGATLYIHKPDGTIFTRTVNVATDRKSVTVGTGNAPANLVGCVFVLSAVNVTPRLYRIISVDEDVGGKTFKITGLQYDPNKFARVEHGINFDPLPVTVDRTKVEPPTDLKITSRSYTDGGRVRTDVEISWKPSPSQLVSEYRVFVNTPTAANVLVGSTDRNSISYSTYEGGQYTFRVMAYSVTGARSAAISQTYTVEGPTSIAVGRIDNLVNAATLQGGSNVGFLGGDVRLSWQNMMRVSSVADIAEVDTDDAIYSHTTVEVFFGSTKVRSARVRGNSWIYTLEMNRADAQAAGFSTPRRAFTVDVYLVDKFGRRSAATSIGLRNPAPAAIAPAVENDANYFEITWPALSDRDIEGYLVYVMRDGLPVVGKQPTRITTANSLRFKAVSLTPYWISVVGYDAFGRDALNYATPLAVVSGFDGADDNPPETPTGLTLNGVIDDATGQVDVTASWNSSRAEDFDYFKFSLDIEGSQHTLDTPDPMVEFTVAQNTFVVARVRARDKTFNWSEWSVPCEWTAPVDNTPPAVPTGLKIQPGWGAFLLSWNANAEGDMARYEVWEGTTATPPAVGATATYPSVSTMLSLTGYANGERRYFAIRAVDLGGNASDWSELVSSKTTTLSVVTLPTPGAPTLSSSLVGSNAEITVNWNAVEDADLYDVEVTADGNPITQPVIGTSFKFTVLPGAAVSVRVRGSTRLGEKSEWSTATAHEAVRDTVAPAQVTGFEGTAGIKMVVLKWTASTATDLSHYEVYQSASTTAPTVNTVPTYKSGSTSLMVGSLNDNTTYYFWARALDVSGNKGAWSSRVDVTTTTVDGLINNAIADSTWAADLGFIKPYVGPALPTTNIGKTIEWNGKLYTWNGTAYVSAADFSDITFEDVGGALDPIQIPDGVIPPEKLEPESLTADQIAKGTLTAEELADGAVTPAKISETLDQLIKAQGVSAAADKAAAEAAKLAAEGHAIAARGYSDAAQVVKNDVEGRYAEITQTAGVVSAAKQVSVLASGNERFQFELEGWLMSGGRLTNLAAYMIGNTAPLWIFDPENNVHQGAAISFARSSASSVTINGTNYAVAANKPRYFVTSNRRFLRISASETIGISIAQGTVDVKITKTTGQPTIQKGVTINAGWWPGTGDFYSVLIYPSGTL